MRKINAMSLTHHEKGSSMFTAINGWTKAAIITLMEKTFTGYSAKGERHIGASNCAYRGDKGTKCAVGLFIPDSMYQPEMDSMQYFVDRHQNGTGVEQLLELFPYLRVHMPLPVPALQELQKMHDQNENGTLQKMVQWVNENVEA